ncbi:MFS transporter [Kitasatospora cinereorecta]|uniref:MFS transporter n=1 Tax=Kitasatospora cinereorecta TaxID=285560 RepID=A0ABW0V2R6_9ACTN
MPRTLVPPTPPRTRTRPRRSLRPRIGRRGAFALHASVLAGLLAASSAPTPLYARYQADWHLSALSVTVVFAAYAVALLLALLCTGTLSDHLGRRPVLLGALAAETAAMALLATAHDAAGLIAARIVQGLATGAATSAAGAALLETEDPRRPGRAALANSLTPVGGMAAGVLVATALVAFAPAPTRTVYLVLAALFLAQAAGVALTRERAVPRPGALRSLRPSLAPAPAPASRRALLLAGPAVAAAWALGGFYSSLGPSLARLTDPAIPASARGLVFFTLTTSAALAVRATAPLPATGAVRLGAAALLPAALLTAAAPHLHSPTALFAATALAGAGFGAVNQGALRLILPPAAPKERAGTLAAYYVLSYLAMSLPAIGAGWLTTRAGLTVAVLAYTVVIAVLTLAALAALRQYRAPHAS